MDHETEEVEVERAELEVQDVTGAVNVGDGQSHDEVGDRAQDDAEQIGERAGQLTDGHQLAVLVGEVVELQRAGERANRVAERVGDGAGDRDGRGSAGRGDVAAGRAGVRNRRQHGEVEQSKGEGN